VDLTDTIAPKSDQLNAEDLLAGPRTVTVTDVRQGASAEQPVDIVTAEFGTARPFKPSKTVRRILVAAWGAEANAYVGRRMTLYRDPDVRFGGDAVGGIRVSALSHIDKPLSVSLTVTRGKRAAHKVQPLPELSPVERLRAEWQTADPERRKVIEAEVAALQQPAAPVEPVAETVAQPVDEFDPTAAPDWPADGEG
jgi:hypothetical protein